VSPHGVYQDAQIQLISGHESKKSLDLEVYQHLSLESVDKAYQECGPEWGESKKISVGLYVPLLG